MHSTLLLVAFLSSTQALIAPTKTVVPQQNNISQGKVVYEHLKKITRDTYDTALTQIENLHKEIIEKSHSIGNSTELEIRRQFIYYKEETVSLNIVTNNVNVMANCEFVRKERIIDLERRITNNARECIKQKIAEGEQIIAISKNNITAILNEINEYEDCADSSKFCYSKIMSKVSGATKKLQKIGRNVIYTTFVVATFLPKIDLCHCESTMETINEVGQIVGEIAECAMKKMDIC